MKIIINAYQYAPTVTGTDRMAYNFLQELQKIDKSNEYVVVCSSEKYIQSIITAPNFKVLQPKHLFKSMSARRIVNKVWRETLNLRLKPLKADVYFSFHNMRLPKKRIAKRMIASNLDLIPLVLDEYKDFTLGQLEEIRSTAMMADEFISISQFSKDELHKLLGVEKSKIHVIHLAADKTLAAPAKRNPNIPKQFIFTIGGSEPRKNVITVARAFAELPEKVQKQYPLLIAGGEWHGRSLKSLHLSPYIHTLGYIDDSTLSYLYQHATAFVFASRYEGFGFTILEAMAAGTPVINAKGSSLDEVAGNATLTFSPLDVHGLAKTINRTLSDDKLRHNLIRKGYRQVKKFSWNNSAKKLHELLTS